MPPMDQNTPKLFFFFFFTFLTRLENYVQRGPNLYLIFSLSWSF